MSWIKVEDGFPESRKMYLVHLESGGVWAAYYRYWGDEKRELWQLPHYDCDVFNWEDEKITHWMPLPEAPTVFVEEK